jgi:RNA polymerase sigma factor (sigma-70 family)
MSLLKAVEKFDYARGYEFSTYASWAVMKNFARSIPEESYRLDRYVTGRDELLDVDRDPRRGPHKVPFVEGLRRSLNQVMSMLDDREREIIVHHYGLGDGRQSRTLAELGERFGVTKERVRQIEARAIKKLRRALSPEELDLLSFK